MTLERTIEIWENGEPLEFQIRYFLSVIRTTRAFNHYKENGAPRELLEAAENYAKACHYDRNLLEKLGQIPIIEKMNKS